MQGLKLYVNILSLLIATLLMFGCDTNLLGGKNSRIGELYEPGKRVESLPPTIGFVSDFLMDENDVQTIPFTITDPDTFIMCNSINVRATSTNSVLIDTNEMVIGGTAPNCNIKLSPKAFKYGVSQITLELFDFWTTVTSSFQLTVVHIEAPGFFYITEAEGLDKSVMVTWSNAAYMNGTSGRYSLFYRPTGTTGPYTEITPVRSPWLVTGLNNGTSYDFYVRARNSIGSRNTTIVSATPTKYRLQGGEFISGSNQMENSANRNYITYSTTGGRTDDLKLVTTPRGYKVYQNSQGNIISGVGP